MADVWKVKVDRVQKSAHRTEVFGEIILNDKKFEKLHVRFKDKDKPTKADIKKRLYAAIQAANTKHRNKESIDKKTFTEDELKPSP